MNQFQLRMPDYMFDWLASQTSNNRDRQTIVRKCIDDVINGKKGHCFSDEIEEWIKEEGGDAFLSKLLSREKSKADKRKEIAALNEGDNPFE